MMEKKKNKEISSGKEAEELIDSGDQLLLYNLYALLQRLRVQRVRHKTCLNIKDGIELFVKTLKKGSTKYQETQSQYIDELSLHIEEIVRTFHGKDIYSLLSTDPDSDKENLQAFLVDYFVEKLNFLTSRGRLKEADTLVQKIQSIKDKLPFEFKIELFREIATTYLKNGELQIGLDLLKQLEQDCRENPSKGAFIQLFPVYVQMGWAYRLLGNIRKADNCYEEADALIIDEDLLPGIDIDLIEVAFLTQTWAYTKALLGKSREAKQFIKVSRSKFKEVGFDLGEGFIESVSGRIQIEFDDYEDAIRCFEKAKDIFPDDNKEWQSKILLGLAEAHILRSEYEKNTLSENEIQNDINLACTYLEKVEHWNYPSEQPELLFSFGNLYIRKKDFNKAETYYRKAWKESENQGSLYYLYRSLIGQMRVTLFNRLKGDCHSCKTANEYIGIHKALIKEYSGITADELANAIFNKTIGDLHFLEGNHDNALECYKENLPVIAEKGRFYAISLKGQLDRMQAIFLAYATKSKGKADEEKVANVHALAQKLWDYWKEKKYTRRYPSANPVIRSWISGRIDEWSHAPTDNKNKKELGEE